MVIPAGVTQIAIDMTGGKGGPCSYNNGGAAGRVQVTLNVTPGQTYGIYVGSTGAYTGANGGVNGTNGYAGHVGGNGSSLGAGGGAATEIWLGTTCIAVAGAGGGGSWDCTTDHGGLGGGLVAGNGLQCGSYSSTYCGAGGNTTTSTGGAAGSCGGASAGTQFVGGNSGGSTSWQGGGGGGYYGGGGGCSYGSGGGGSSYPAAVGGNVVGLIHTQGYNNTGNGSVTVTVLCSPPGTITGNPGPICAGGVTATLTATASGGTWGSSNTSVATVSSGGLVTSVAPGTAVITYTVGNPCGGVSASTTITVSPTPSALPATSNVCQYGTTTLTDTASGGTWASSNPAAATVAGGIVTGVNPGTSTISYTLPSGCATSSVMTIKPAPAIFNITGGGPFCAGGTGVPIGVSGSNAGNNYALTLSGGTVSTLPGTGSSLSFGLITLPGTYTVIATNTISGCSNTMTGSAVVTINPLPAAITGATNVCVGGTASVSDPASGGVWTTSNPGQATIGLSGNITGITASTPNISYTFPGTGCYVTMPFTVNPVPAAIVVPSGVCVSQNTTLTDPTTGGTWSSGNTAIATVGGGSGVVTGVSPGTVTMTYSLGSGCSVSSSVVVNTLPSTYSLTGGGSYCAGGAGVHVGLSYSNSGVTYQLFNSGIPITSVAGSNSGLDFGLQTGAGSYTVTATNTITGCSINMPGFVVVSILSAPTAFNVIGGGNYCTGGAGVTVGLDGSGTGIKYQLYNGTTPVGGLVSGTGSPISFGLHTAGTYTVLGSNTVTGCTGWMSGNQTITTNPLPNPYLVTGGGSYCTGGAGADIQLANSDFGVTYQLMHGGAVSTISSSGGPIDFGLFTSPGVYTVVATDGATCTNTMTGSVTVAINPLPTAYVVTGGGNYCSGGAGSHVGLAYSTVGVNYQLYNGGPVGAPVAGSGTSLDFGAQTAPGCYTVVATNPITHCSNNMTGTSCVGINPLPDIYNVTGGGNYCAGGAGVNIGVDFSDIGTSYQVYRGITPAGAPVAGTGSLLNLGTVATAGTYTVVATIAGTGCVISMAGSVVVGINPLPLVHTVTGGGNYCAGDTGVHVMLNTSDVGINYQLIIGATNVGLPVPGTGSGIDFGLQTASGTYTVVGTNPATLCAKLMSGSATIYVNPLPAIFNMTGGGAYCAGGTGSHVNLDGSSTGISYQLFNGGPSGTPLSGSGGPLDFGLKTALGSYTAWATNVLTGCKSLMNGASVVSTNPLPVDYPMAGGGTRCAADPGIDVDLSNSDTGVDYQLYKGGVAVPGALVTGIGSSISFGLQTAAGVYTVIATDHVTGCRKTMTGTAVINVVVPTVYAVTGGGNYCAGGTGVHVILSGSSTSDSYQLYEGSAIVGSPVTGTGTSLDFGLVTAAGTYTVTATNIAYSCVANMAGSAVVGINPLPGVFNVTGTGSYCAGGTGLHVGLDGSATAIQYQLWSGSTALGLPITGTGMALDYGIFTAPGTYIVKATNPVTTCHSDMTGSAVIVVNPLPTVYTLGIENNGYYCAADTTGVHIYVGSSDTGVSYKLYRGTTLVATSAGTGAVLDLGRYLIAGTYTVVATGSGCSSNMTGSVDVHIVPLPVVHNVTGGGHYCPGGNGVHIGIDASDLGVKYTLNRVGVPSDTTTIYGTGLPVDYGLRDSVGVYTVSGTSDPARLTGCTNNMLGSATIAIDAVLTPTVTVQSYPAIGLGVWRIDSLHANVINGGPNPAYQWKINGNPIAGETHSSFTHYAFFNGDNVTCDVTASGPCGGNSGSGSIVITLHASGVQVLTNQGDVKLIPNPNKGTFTVKGTLGNPIAIGTDEEVSLEVTNMLGQVIYNNKVMSKDGSIDQRIELNNNLANGMYILNLRSASQNTVFHFVMEK
jgi:Secretion system C-terminal sorting domain/Bacterial Ig-like domain (group 2)